MLTPTLYTDLGNLNITGNYTFAAGNYLVGSLNINGNSTVNVVGTVRIWFKNLNLAGVVGAGGTKPSQLQFFSRSDAGQVNINGNCKLSALVFAPNVPINDSGTHGIYGALVGSTVTLNGNVEVHYDEDLGTDCHEGGHEGDDGEGDGREHDLEISRAMNAPKNSSDLLGLPQGKDLIAVPNPSKGRTLAIFRLANPGNARLTLLNIAGQAVVRVQAHDLPAGQNVLPVDISHVAPGVYILTLEGDSDFGTKLLSTFKMAVIP